MKMDASWILSAAFCVFIAPSAAAAASDDADAIAFFEKKIRPVLVQHCYKCHSAESRPLKGNLLLDHASGVLRGGDTGPSVIAGKPADSLLLKALKYDSFEMPPEGRLPDEVIRDFEKWIADGAVDPRTSASAMPVSATIDIEAGRQFWAFQPPVLSPWLAEQQSVVPSGLADSQRIDALVQRAMDEHGLSAAPAADARTLARRLSFDLTGLPPSAEAVAALAADPSVPAYTQLVDRLLDSPAFGERWARLWLDVARYAEDQAHIVGGNKELFYPNAWHYRDWVIHSLNDDMPYDQFVRLQLAADQIAPEDLSAQAALGFIGLGPKYYRRNDPEVMAEEWEDRVDVVAAGLQGLTVVCARCHDHKFDPIPTTDYYALAGVFAGTEMFNRPLTTDKAVDGNGQAKNPDESLHVIRDKKSVDDLNLMIRGNVHQPGPKVPRGFLQVVLPGEQRTFHEGSGRKELAESITDARNPLTARVIVNRVWQQYFGRGLVATLSNFGHLGERPTHPELLDDLAIRFMQSGWSLKWLHRQIVLSETYRRSSIVPDSGRIADPANLWLSRMPRRRLSIEAWRDAVLQTSGRLDPKVGGPSMRPDDPQQSRRTVYSEISRFELNPLLARFDFPDPNVHSARRSETNTPLQKLFLLNSPFMLAQAAAFAECVTALSSDPQQNIRSAFQLALQRDPDSEELAATAAYLSEHPETGWNDVAQSLLASNEFWYLD